MSRCRKNLWKGLRFPGSKGNMKEVRLSKKAKKEKKRPGKRLAVAKPCIFAQQSASHAANAAKKGWRTPFSFKITPRRPAGLVPRRAERSDRRRPPCAANGAAGPVRRQLGAKAKLFRQAVQPRLLNREAGALCAVHYSGVCGAGRVYRTISTHTPTAVTASVTGMANQTAPGPSRAGSA